MLSMFYIIYSLFCSTPRGYVVPVLLDLVKTDEQELGHKVIETGAQIHCTTQTEMENGFSKTSKLEPTSTVIVAEPTTKSTDFPSQLFITSYSHSL